MMNEDYKVDLDDNEKAVKIDKNHYGLKIKALKIGRHADGKFGYIFLPQVEVNGTMCTIKEEGTQSGCIECESKILALKTATTERERIIERQKKERRR